MTEASDKVLEALAVSAEICGHTFTEAAARVVGRELARFEEKSVLRALARCVREVKGRLTLADIIERIDDGRPSPDEAWALVGHDDEERTIVATEEAMEAWGLVRELLREDHVAARMAFRERYAKLMQEARAHGVPARWIASLGHNPGLRAAALQEAARQGKLAAAQVDGLLGPAPAPPSATALPAMALIKALAAGEPLPEPPPSAAAALVHVPDVRPPACAAAWCDGIWHYSTDPNTTRRPTLRRCPGVDRG